MKILLLLLLPMLVFGQTINVYTVALDSGLVLKGSYSVNIDSVKISGVKQSILLQNDTVIKIRQPYSLSPTNQVRNLDIFASTTNQRYYIRYSGDVSRQECHIAPYSSADIWINAFSTDFNSDTVENIDTIRDKFVSKNMSTYINNVWDNDSIVKFTGNKINSIETVKYSDGLGLTRRKVSIVNDPANPFNKVCRMWGDTTSSSSFRLQSEISSPWATGIKKLRYTVRLFVPYQMSVLKNMSSSLGWFTIAEFWNDVAHSGQIDENAFRLTIGIGKNVGVGNNLHFIVSTDSFSVNEGVYTQHRIVDTIIETFTIPFDRWMELEYYYNDDAYDTQTDTSFYMSVTESGGSKQTLFSNRIRLHSMYNTSGRGLTFLSPIKMYCAQSTVEYITNNNGGRGSELFYVNLTIWVKE